MTLTSEHDATRVRPFDFRRPARLGDPDALAVDALVAPAGRSVATEWSRLWGLELEVRSIALSEAPLDLAQEGRAATVLAARGLPGSAAASIPLPQAHSLVERLLGATRPEGGAERELTDLEADVLEVAVVPEAVALYRALVPGAPALTAQDRVAFDARLVPGNGEPGVNVDLEVGADGVDLHLRLALPAAAVPASTLRPSGFDLDAGATSPSPDIADRLEAVLVELTVELPPTTMTSAAVLALAPGDVVAFGHPTGEPVHACVGGVATFLVRPAHHGARLACQIVGHIEHEEHR